MNLPISFKFCVANEEESRLVQEKLFLYGHYWGISGKSLSHLGEKFFYSRGKQLYYGEEEDLYDTDDIPEVTVNHILTGKVNWKDLLTNRREVIK